MKKLQSSANDPLGIFNRLVDDNFQLDLLKAVISQYEASYVHCCEVFAPAAREDILPYYRRAKIENVLEDLANQHESCSVKIEKNLARNCCHSLMFLGERIALTQSKVEKRGSLPRDAEFRGSYARSPQMVFDFVREELDSTQSDDAVLYGIIVHSPQEIERFPRFVDIVFPDSQYEYLLDKIPLMEKFPDIVAQFHPEEEDIKSEADEKVQLRSSSSDVVNA